MSLATGHNRLAFILLHWESFFLNFVRLVILQGSAFSLKCLEIKSVVRMDAS